MQAIHFVDVFLQRQEGVEVCTLQLIGISAIWMAVKLNEQCYLSLDQCCQACQFKYSREQIEKCEQFILNQLEWRTNCPTPIEIIQYTLSIANADYDFSQIIERSMVFAQISLMGKSLSNLKSSDHGFADYELSRLRPSTVGISAVLVTLEERSNISFRDTWLSFVRDRFPQIDQVRDCV